MPQARRPHTPRGRIKAWLLEPAYQLDPDGDLYELDENDQRIEIVDPVTVEIMVAGSRRVASTLRERTLAAERMIRIGLSPQEVAEHIGTVVGNLGPVIGPLGYEVAPRCQGGKRKASASCFRKVEAS
jgi:hypothetical protein